MRAQLSRSLKSAASKPVTCQLARAQQLRQGRLRPPAVPRQHLRSRDLAAWASASPALTSFILQSLTSGTQVRCRVQVALAELPESRGCSCWTQTRTRK